jgi:hypothetical protein
MDVDSSFDEVVLFEMPNQDEAERLWLRLQPFRLAWVHRRNDTHLVAVALRAESTDLALLLRELEAWLADRGVPEVQFELDGRTYALRGRPATLAGTLDRADTSPNPR